jgi:hypothetical protein
MSHSLINVQALRKDILVDIYDDGEESIELAPGRKFILLEDTQVARDRDGSESHAGIRPRWAKVLATTDYAEEAGIEVGMKVLCDTMKWFRGINYASGKKMWRIPADDILFVDDGGFTEEEVSKLEERFE